MRAPLGIKLKNQRGFTIIEVMIVLAVASLIMLVVLLAVPALQRSSRNSSRTSDATKIAAAVSECLSNRNNVIGSCNDLAGSKVFYTGTNSTLDTTSLKQLTTVTTSTSTAIGAIDSTSASWPSGTGAAIVYFNEKCSTDGASTLAGSSTTQFVVLFNNEGGSGSVPRCISS